MSLTRFTTFDADDDTGAMSITDIIQLSDMSSAKANRRRLMI